MTACPTAAELEGFVQGTLRPPGADRVALHLDACATCSDRIAWLERTLQDELLDRLRRAATASIELAGERKVQEAMRRLESALPGTARHGTPPPAPLPPAHPGRRTLAIAAIALAALAIAAVLLAWSRGG